MKKYVKKAMEKVAEKKQMTFDVPDVPQTEQRKKTIQGKPKSTYWICVNGHVFEHKYKVHPARLENMGCPICNGKIRNESTKSTYLYHLNKTGRGDVKKYRADKILKEKKRMKKKEANNKSNLLMKTGQESDV